MNLTVQAPPLYKVVVSSHTYTVNIVTPTPYSVTVTGVNTYRLIINQTILQGPKGDKGDQGDTGPEGPPGTDGNNVDFVFGETPSGLVNGSNATFTTAFNFIPGTVIPSINGLEQKVGTHYITMGNNQIIFNDSPTTGEIITVTYIKT